MQLSSQCALFVPLGPLSALIKSLDLALVTSRPHEAYYAVQQLRRHGQSAVTEKSRIVTGAKCKLCSAPLRDCVTTNYIGYTVLGRRKGMTSLNVSIYTGLWLPIQIE